MQELDLLDDRDHARQQDTVTAALDDDRHARGAEQQPGEVQQRQQRPTGIPADPAVGALREHQREVQKERRQQQHAGDVTPVKHPVESIESPSI